MWLGMDLLSTHYVPGSGPSEVLCATLCPPSSPDQGELGDPSMGPGQLRILSGGRKLPGVGVGGWRATQRLEVSDQERE